MMTKDQENTLFGPEDHEAPVVGGNVCYKNEIIKIIPIDAKWPRPVFYQVWCQDNGNWLSVKYGFLPPAKQNIRHYSRFKTEASANRAIIGYFNKIRLFKIKADAN